MAARNCNVYKVKGFLDGARVEIEGGEVIAMTMFPQELFKLLVPAHL